MRGSLNAKALSSPRKKPLPASHSERGLKKTVQPLKATFSPRNLGKPAVLRPQPEQSPRSSQNNSDIPPIPRKFSITYVPPESPKLPLIRPRVESEAVVVSPRLRDMLRHDLQAVRSPKGEKRVHFCESQIGTVLQRAKPNNQDSSFYIENSVPPFTAMGVCDGHGQHGHFVSSFLSTRLPDLVRAHVMTARGTLNWTQILLDSFRQSNADLRGQQFDTTCSGSTCVCVILVEGRVYCGNVGDSRAVLGRKQGSGVTAVALSKDHKPDVPEEHLRIIQSGGRVDPVFSPTGEPVGPPRVWFQNEDFPGLAMSRVLGDGLASRIGVIPVPEVTATDLTPDDQFIIAASDGVWEFITSQEAVSIVNELWSAGKGANCCKALVELAMKRWHDEEDSVDDITVAIVGVGR